MKKILLLFLLIPYIAFGQTKYTTDTLVTRIIKAKTIGKIYVRDTLVLKDGNKQISALTEALKSNWNSAYNLSHYHANLSLLSAIKPQDTTRWAQGGSTITSRQIIDSISHRANLPVTKKIPFTKINNQVNPFQMTGNTTLLVDTVGSISGGSSVYQILGLSGYTLSHGQPWSPIDTTNTNRVINTITGKLYTWLGGCFGSGNYRLFKYNLIDSTQAPGAPIQLSAPGSFTASVVSQTQINLSWSLPSPNGRNFQLYDSIVGVSSAWNLLNSPSKTATSYNHTGLTNGQHVYYRIRTVGNGSDTLTSVYATANATTSALTQLSTPTNGTVTVNSSTQLTANVSGVDANATYLGLDYKETSSGTWTNFSSTLPRSTTSQALTSLSPATSYDIRWIAIGDNVTYSNSSYSTTQSGTTLGTAPTFSSGYTSANGDTAHVLFSKEMQASPSSTGLSFSGSHPITSITRHATNTSMYDIIVSSPFTNGETITLSYTPGTITASDGGVLASFSNQSITNNVPSTGDYYRLNGYGTEFFVYDAKDAANFTLSGSDINTIKDGSPAGNTMTYSSNTKFTYNSTDKYFTGGASKDGIYAPASNFDMGSTHSIVFVANIASGTAQSMIGRSATPGGLLIKTASSTWIVYYPTSENVGPQMIWDATGYFGAKHVFVITRNGATIKLYIDGTLISQLGGTMDTSSSIIKGIGSSISSEGVKANIYYEGAINAELSAGDVTTISNALNARY